MVWEWVAGVLCLPKKARTRAWGLMPRQHPPDRWGKGQDLKDRLVRGQPNVIAALRAVLGGKATGLVGNSEWGFHSETIHNPKFHEGSEETLIVSERSTRSPEGPASPNAEFSIIKTGAASGALAFD